MPLDMEIGPGHIVLDGDPAPPIKKGTQQPLFFGPCLLWPDGRPSQQLLSCCCLAHTPRMSYHYRRREDISV